MKKTTFIILLLITCISFFLPNMSCKAENVNLTPLSKASVIIEANSGEVLFEHKSEDARPIASMVKIMTLICVYDAISQSKIALDTKVAVSNSAAGMGGSQAFLDANSEHTVGDLIKTIVISSANDSCVALAEHIFGSQEAFVSIMNEKADSLQLKNTHFTNCTGLPALNQFSCAIDVAVMMRELIQNEDYFNHSKIWMEDYKHPGGRVTGLTNTNKLIRFYQGCDGGKTGYTSEAQHCLCATAKRGNMRLISVVIGAPDSETRFAESKNLLNYAFSNFEMKTYALSAEDSVIEVKGGKTKTSLIEAEKPIFSFGKKGQVKFNVTLDVPDKVKAPIRKGDVVGQAILCNEQGEAIKKVNLVATDSIEKITFWELFKDIFSDWH